MLNAWWISHLRAHQGRPGDQEGTLIVGATLAGYDATPDNTAKLVALARIQATSAKQVGGSHGKR